MEKKYRNWINQNYPTAESVLIGCKEITLKMLVVFPELKRVRGLVYVNEPYGLMPTKAPHFWLVTPEGNIIDPTVHQYPLGVEKYEEWDESLGPPTGKCHNCGRLCHSNRFYCSEECLKKLENYYNE